MMPQSNPPGQGREGKGTRGFMTLLIMPINYCIINYEIINALCNLRGSAPDHAPILPFNQARFNLPLKPAPKSRPYYTPYGTLKIGIFLDYQPLI